MKTNPYNRLGRVQKLTAALAGIRDDPIECPACQMGVPPAELQAHAGRCTGRGWSDPIVEPWLTWAQVMGLGIDRSRISRWVSSGRVRRRTRNGASEYSHADVATALDDLLAWHKVRRSEAARRSARSRWSARRSRNRRRRRGR